MPVEVERLMAAVTAGGSSVKAKAGPSASKEIFSSAKTESRPKSEGFGAPKTVVDTTATMETSAPDRIDTAMGTASSQSTADVTDSAEGAQSVAEEERDTDSSDSPDSRKKRRKAGRKDRKK